MFICNFISVKPCYKKLHRLIFGLLIDTISRAVLQHQMKWEGRNNGN